MTERKGLVIKLFQQDDGRGNETIGFGVNTGTKQAGKMFVPLTEAQYTAFEAYQKTSSARTGFGKIEISHSRTLVEWKSFFPLGTLNSRKMEMERGLSPPREELELAHLCTML